MCIFNRPSPPPLPEPRPVAPKPEKTAQRVVVGQQRTAAPASTSGEGRRLRGRKSIRNVRRLGTASLIIPLLNQGRVSTGNLKY